MVNPVPPVEFAPARGGRIAYQVWGEGEQTIVAVPPSAQNIEVAWERPEIAAMLTRFGSFSRYVHFDKRGTGSSDRTSLVPGIDERVDDLRAVMDAAGIDRAHLFAQSEGGPMTLLFAATYPQRVQSVTLLGSAAQMVPDGRSDAELARMKATQEAFVTAWGTPDSFAVDLFAPSKAADPDFRSWHIRYERLAASADSLRDLFDQMNDMDVRDVLGDIEAPVLVITRTDDALVDVDMAREVTELVPDGRFVELPGNDHFGYLGDVDAWMTEIERFVTGEVQPHVTAPPPTDVRIETLGRFSVIVNGTQVPISAWGSRRARTLLKRLVVARGWPVTREELFELLWPDETDTSKLSARLSVLLSGVRKILGGGVIADRQTIALDLGHVSCDVVDLFEADHDATVVSIYAGEFLPEDVYDDWTVALRDEARRRFTDAARRRMVSVKELGRSDLVVDLARMLTEADPYDEAAHLDLVAALEGDGDRVGVERERAAWHRRMDDDTN